VRDAHRHTDPRLEPVPDGRAHEVACLLPAATRRAIWSELRAGHGPRQARAAVEVRGKRP
jgi:peptide/nickel transport system ATP-binding protein